MAYVAGLAVRTAGFPTSISGSLDVGSNANRRIVGLLCHVGSDATRDFAASEITYAGSNTGVTISGGGAHLIASGGNEKCRWFHIDVPSGTTGSNTLSVDQTGYTGSTLVMIAVAYDGISAVSAAQFAADAFNNNPTSTITSATGEEVVGLLLNYDNDGATFTVGTGSSLLSGFAATDNLLAFREDGAAAVTIDGTWAASHARVFAAFSLTALVPPAITGHPVGNAAAVGATAQYSITETGATSYQWQVSTNGGETWASVSGGSGGTTATYTTPTTVAADNGKKYRCVATNSNGSTNSRDAFFHVSGIGLSGRGRGTSRAIYQPLIDPLLLAQIDPRVCPQSGPACFDDFATAFKDLYFYSDPTPPAVPNEVDLWTWSTRNRPGSGPLSTGAFYIAPQRIWAPAASGPIDLAAGAQGSASSSAALTTAILVAAASAGQATLTAALSAGVAMSATPTGVGSMTAALTTGIALSAGVSGAATLTAAMGTGIALAAAAQAAAAVTGALSTSITLQAAPAGVATVTASLTAGSGGIAADAAGQATLTAALTTGIAVAAAAAGVATVSAAFSTGIALASSPAGAASASGALTTGIALAAQPQGVATVTAALTTLPSGLAATPSGQATMTASLSTGIRLVAAAQTQAQASAALDTAIALASAAQSSASVTATLTGSAAALAAALIAQAQASAALSAAIRMQAAMAGIAGATASLTTGSATPDVAYPLRGIRQDAPLSGRGQSWPLAGRSQGAELTDPQTYPLQGETQP